MSFLRWLPSHGGRSAPTSWAAEIRGVFSIDIRSLAALRIGLGLLLLSDLWFRSRFLLAHYTDLGVLPRAARIALCEQGDHSGLGYSWSLHMLSGEFRIQAILFGVAAWFACWLTIGYRTRLSALVSWVLLISLQARNPMILQGGDVMLRCCLFWSLFLPLAACWSVDARLRPPALGSQRHIFSIGSVALLAQVACVYLFCAALKNHPVWTRDYTGVYYALNIDQFTTRAGYVLLRFPGLMKFLSWFTFWLEWVGPLLAFVPGTRGLLRTGVVMAFWMFHLGLGLAMELGPFPYVAMVAWTAFLPTEFWNLVSRRLNTPAAGSGISWADDLRGLAGEFRDEIARVQALVTRPAAREGWNTAEPGWNHNGAVPEPQRVEAGSASVATRESPAAATWDSNFNAPDDVLAKPLPSLTPLLFRNPERPRLRLGAIPSTVAALLLIYMIVWNLRETFPPPGIWWRILPISSNPIGRATFLDQRWNMFSPTPLTDDGWFVMRGTLRDGSQVNLWEPGEVVTAAKPALVSTHYPTERWRKYLMTIYLSENYNHRPHFADWLRRRWNAGHTGGEPARKVQSVEIIYQREITPPPGQPLPPPEPVQLWLWHYEP